MGYSDYYNAFAQQQLTNGWSTIVTATTSADSSYYTGLINNLGYNVPVAGVLAEAKDSRPKRGANEEWLDGRIAEMRLKL